MIFGFGDQRSMPALAAALGYEPNELPDPTARPECPHCDSAALPESLGGGRWLCSVCSRTSHAEVGT